MRRSGPILVAGLTALVMGGCGQPLVDDMLYLQTPRGVTAIRAGASGPSFVEYGAIPTRDWSTVVRSRPNGTSTRVTALIPSTATRLWTQSLNGDWRVKIVSEDGNFAALGSYNERSYKYGRRNTSLAIVDSRGHSRKFGLSGNIEPEAFSTDGKNLFVLQYTPPRRPTRYQVRRMDLTTGKLHDVFTPDAHLQTAMRGTARVQASSSDGSRLYTLYTVGTGDSKHAFIHVLSLDELWAHCIDLPHDFARSAESAALTVDAETERLYVANANADAIAEIDTDNLRVVGEGAAMFPTADATHAVVGPENTLYVASGAHLTAIDLGSMETVRSWTMSNRVSGIQISNDELKIYVGLRDEVMVLDASSGKTIKKIDPKGVGRIGRLGKVSPSLDQIPDKFACAC